MDKSDIQHYDYVIAGGGSAGCVAASRLSENPAVRVLLIEAGRDTPPGREPAEIRSPVPAVIFHGTRYLWPKLRVAAFRGRRAQRFYEQARVLGGGSSVNAQVGNRGIPEDYEEWQRLGAEGWDWQGVLPYFRRLERDLDYAGNVAMHGADGPVPIYRVPRSDWGALSQQLAAALEDVGLHDIGDQNGVFEDGYFSTAFTNENNHRVTAAMAYLPAEVRRRDNLVILTDSLVTRITFSGQRACGLAYEAKGRAFEVTAGEVILALGALQTPAMLMRAGIGPSDILQRHGIAPRAVREGVGKNLCDHPGTHLCAVVKPQARMRAGATKAAQVALRFTSRSPYSAVSDLYLQSGIASAWHKVGQRVSYFYLALYKFRSRGEVTLKDADPHSMPDVNLNLLDAEGDAERLAEGFRYTAALLSTPQMSSVIDPPFALRYSPFIRFVNQVRPLNRLVMTILGRMLDGPAWLRRLLGRYLLSNGPSLGKLLADDARLIDYLKHNMMSVFHVSGTCRMGRPDDPQAVVDAEGRVYGIDGLRIVDASVMPVIPRANTNVVTFMVAEKMCDAILRGRATATAGQPKEI